MSSKTIEQATQMPSNKSAQTDARGWLQLFGQ